MKIRNIRKLLGSILGSLTAGGVIGVAALFGLTIPVEAAAAIVTIAAWAGTYVSPKNAEE